MSRTINTMPERVQQFARAGVAVPAQIHELSWRGWRSHDLEARARFDERWGELVHRFAIDHYSSWPRHGGARAHQHEATRLHNRSNRHRVRQLLAAAEYERAELATGPHRHSATRDLY